MVKYLLFSLFVFLSTTCPYFIFAQGMQVGSGAHLVLKDAVYVVVTGGGDMTLASGSSYSSDEQSALQVEGSLINENEAPVSIGEAIFEGEKKDTLSGNFNLSSLSINTSSQIFISGNTQVEIELNLINGKLVVPASSQFLINEDVNTLVGSNSYILGLLGINVSGSGEKEFYFPIGTVNRYTPVTLQFNKDNPAPATFSLEASEESMPEKNLPPSIKALHDSLHWKLNVSDAAAFTDGIVTLPLTFSGIDSISVIKSEGENWADLEGEILQDSSFIKSKIHFNEGGIFAIGKQSSIQIAADLKPAEGFVSAASSPDAQLTFTKSEGLDPGSVILKYRSLRKEEYQSQETQQVDSSFNVALSADLFGGDFGIEYYFEYKDKDSNTYKSNKAFAYFQYGKDALIIGDLKAGEKVTDYQIISIPLELDQKAVSSVMDEFGKYDSTQWRLFHYVDDHSKNVEYSNSSDIIERGKGYWLITKNSKDIAFGDGNMALKNGKPYEIQLSENWNQIGNPYNFEVKWSDILKVNGLKEEDIKNSGYRDGIIGSIDNLKAYEGVFVENTSSIEKLIIPYKSDNSNNGKTTQSKNKEGWVLTFSLKGGGMGYNIGGLGMHPSASENKDIYDADIFPRFISYLDINFGHDITKDMVPVQEEYIWKFNVETNLEADNFALSWKEIDGLPWNKQLILYDTEKNIAIDMLSANKYAFELSGGSRAFEVYYGIKDMVFEKIASDKVRIGDPFPVPVSDNVSFSILLPKNKQGASVRVDIFNSLGEEVNSLERKGLKSGYSELKIQRSTLGGTSSGGLYFYRFYVDNKLIKNGRLIFNF